MPQYPIPPWIRGADPAPHFARGYGMGQQGAEAAARIAMAQQQLAADAQRAQIEVNLKQQSIERQAIEKQQELEVARAYHDQQVALQQTKLDQAQQKIEQDAKKAAQSFQALQTYRAAVAAGADPSKAALDALPYLPSPMQNMVMKEQISPPPPSDPLGKLYQGRERAVQMGNTAMVKNYDAAIAQSVANKGRSIYMGVDNDGRPIFQMTEGGAEPTVAMQSQAQEKLAQYENTIELMNSLQHQLKPGHVGIKGALGEVIVDKTLAQFMPGVAVGDRIDARTALKVLRSSLLRQVPDAASGRISSVAEREEVDAALPEAGWHESYEDAMQKIKTLRKNLENRARTYSGAIGKETPIWTLSPAEIKQLFQSKKISEQQALNALSRFH